ncbi:glycoside hydrolase family 2 protein [Bacteroides sp.]|uniref:glycoside hydrolase family 2 protein n=1 Tax=Bacteroides sp. TaxID=29523 RepID=UPI0025BDE0E6|nr:sugar-binding domain-containing protein [Bacteroides sp.]
MKFYLLSFLLMIPAVVFSQWRPVGDKIKTRWADKITVDNVLPEYPRPIMERNEWFNLNGLWEYAITQTGADKPSVYDGQILVPFVIESSLSGVQKSLGKEKELWYSRKFSLPSGWKGKNILLHFGAVDWKTDVWVNGVKIGEHTGGFTPFCFDITSALKKGNNVLDVKVWDPTDDGTQPRGKQVKAPRTIWYTPVSGIWQTVWLEPVGERYITSLKILPDIDYNRLFVSLDMNKVSPNDIVEVNVLSEGCNVASGRSLVLQPVELYLKNVQLWSPDSPFLYDMEVLLYHEGKVVDRVKSYAAMRKYSTRKDKNGIVRLQLNNKDIFHFGPLDQGWWPDGLYTAPTDEALLYDIQKTKDLGFNMIRKHIKVEPLRWYTHCDRLGMIVWQDMPNGDIGPKWEHYAYYQGPEPERSLESELNYRKEWKEIIDCLYNFPCIGVWVPFNEAWGQFKSCEIAEWTKQYDSSRLVNQASGGNHYNCGDMLDIHHYPQPELKMYDTQRPTVLGEYGGIGMVVPDHIWEPDRNWGYVKFKDAEEVTAEYEKYTDLLFDLISKGFSAAVYTQTTDVEIEVNGLITYDREVVKVDEKRVHRANLKISNSLTQK